jgi:hypothetical protein
MLGSRIPELIIKNQGFFCIDGMPRCPVDKSSFSRKPDLPADQPQVVVNPAGNKAVLS